MDIVYIIIVGFLLILAIVDLYVGVSNDAVNFLSSAVGAKVSSFRTILIVASIGVLIGAIMSAGMMDVARHGVINPALFSMKEVMTIFLAVMVTNVIILDIFNNLGLPTSTTVSMVFALLGGSFVVALIKRNADPSLSLNELLNSEKALTMIIAIFVSVAIAFVAGLIVQWIARVAFSFNYKKYLKFAIAPFGGIAFSALAYFILIKGLGDSPFISSDFRTWIAENTKMLMLTTFGVSAIVSELLYLLKVNVFKIIILGGTFALAMAFAGNDLVNFIGVPFAGLESLTDYLGSGSHNPATHYMGALNGPAKSPFVFLAIAGVIMIISIITSKKAKNVLKTSVDLSRQDGGDEMFGSSKVARSLVRSTRDSGSFLAQLVPASVVKWVDKRFDQNESCIRAGAAFDELRASINLVLAAILIILGTTLKLPLSTTYVTFMVAMGSSLADRAWNRDSAVFRVTGVISVIGGWLMTAAICFVSCAFVALLMHWGGIGMMALFMSIVVFMLVKSNRDYKKKAEAQSREDNFSKILKVKDKELAWEMLKKEVAKTQSFVTRFIRDKFEQIIQATRSENIRLMRKSKKEIKEERDLLAKFRKQQLIIMKRIPMRMAMENNTWYHLAINSCNQYLYCLLRLLEPIEEHTDNNFQPIPTEMFEKFEPIASEINALMYDTERTIATAHYEQYEATRAQAQDCQTKIGQLCEECQIILQKDESNFSAILLFINLLQESQQLLSIMRHQLRASYKFQDK